ncbi:hypothetical protein [Martelella radicis]|uniref:Uncharacterized protein n=1 Tax=Martelella radicis TaxID=1397476 RepID=A0A7W6KKK7_9HYPH|nr:hypothetical protein [Martelella radicis]MBB4122971.1 hypothetical protein [Martelella radicis]
MKNRTLERALLVFGCMLTSAWLASSLSAGAIPWEPIVTALGLFGAWLKLDLSFERRANERPRLHPHDQNLGIKLRKAFDPSTLRFLREHGYASPFDGKILRNLEALADDWHGAENEFESATLDNISAEITRLADELCNKIAIYAGPAERWPDGYLTVPLQEELAADEFSETTWMHIRELREMSSSLVVAFENFEKEFRRLAPDAYKSDL